MGCEGRAGAGQASLGPALASLVPVLFLSTSIKQLKHSLLCKQSLVGFMELQGTMCLSPGPSQPTLQLEMQFSLSFGACPCSLYSCSCLCLHPGAADPASPSPVPHHGDSSGCHRHPAQGWGQLCPHRGDAGSDPDSLEVQTPSPALSQPWGHVGHVCVSCASSFKAIHSFAFSPFLLFLPRHFSSPQQTNCSLECVEGPGSNLL